MNTPHCDGTDRMNKLAFSGLPRPSPASNNSLHANFSRRRDAPAPTGISILFQGFGGWKRSLQGK
jgi:hypothetical protein